MPGTNENIDNAQLEQFLEVAKRYAVDTSENFAGSTSVVTNGNKHMTTRTHVRITGDLMEWADEQQLTSPYTSREMFLGACVSFAAHHPGKLREFMESADSIKHIQEFLDNEPDGTENSESEDKPENDENNDVDFVPDEQMTASSSTPMDERHTSQENNNGPGGWNS